MTFTLRAMGALPTCVPCICMVSILEASRLSEGSVWGRKEHTLVAITRTSRAQVVLQSVRALGAVGLSQCSSLMAGVTV